MIISINFNQKAICAKNLSPEKWVSWKKTKTKQLLSFLFLLHINYRCGSLGNFKTAITLHDLCLLWDMCLHCLHISFVVQTKHVSFTVIYHSVSLQINKKYCFTFTCPKFYFQLFLHKTQIHQSMCVLSQIISMSEELKSVTFIKQTNKRSEV